MERSCPCSFSPASHPGVWLVLARCCSFLYPAPRPLSLDGVCSPDVAPVAQVGYAPPFISFTSFSCELEVRSIVVLDLESDRVCQDLFIVWPWQQTPACLISKSLLGVGLPRLSAEPATWGEHLWVNAEGIFLGTVQECLYIQDVPDCCRCRPSELEGWC